ncbi:hypothetical protein COCON_G00216310 [Conger conger]|uniref:Uncharacterized protein n=1 Tax=Conger conger TaxID=82655 RepID=A0A9Q1HNM1_CONCO|nr:hypothetical protein COCON_G00216310 [Conger conger]
METCLPLSLSLLSLHSQDGGVLRLPRRWHSLGSTETLSKMSDSFQWRCHQALKEATFEALSERAVLEIMIWGCLLMLPLGDTTELNACLPIPVLRH